mmetsp:Transcript_46484/g.110047  ORF Transcript_46484/g.110047 Transcript_46484/m.110047 type:complete len:241 (-) Transcript_46484:466-1188(-)
MYLSECGLIAAAATTAGEGTPALETRDRTASMIVCELAAFKSSWTTAGWARASFPDSMAWPRAERGSIMRAKLGTLRVRPYLLVVGLARSVVGERGEAVSSTSMASDVRWTETAGGARGACGASSSTDSGAGSDDSGCVAWELVELGAIVTSIRELSVAVQSMPSSSSSEMSAMRCGMLLHWKHWASQSRLELCSHLGFSIIHAGPLLSNWCKISENSSEFWQFSTLDRKLFSTSDSWHS